MSSKPQGFAAVEAAYYRKLFKDDDPGTERLSLAFPPKDVTDPHRVEDVKPIPSRQSNRRVRDGLEQAE